MALQPGTSQVQITPVSRYLGISSPLYLLKPLFRSYLACLCGLTGAMHRGRDRGTQKGPSPHPVPPGTHINMQSPRPGLHLDLGKSLYNYTPFAAPPRCRAA